MSRWQSPVGLFLLIIGAYFIVKTQVLQPNEIHPLQEIQIDDVPPSQTHNDIIPLDPCSWKHFEVLPLTAKQHGCTSCQAFNCRALFQTNNQSDVFHQARKWMTDHPLKLKNESHFINVTHNCDSFRKNGYFLRSIHPEEMEYPIAFNLLVHKDIAQLERLLRVLYRPQNEFCIHIDAKAPTMFVDSIKAISKCFPNVNIASRLEYVKYAGFSRLQADINCMKDLTSKPPKKWNYLINIAGQAFPLKTNLEMVRILKVYNGSNDIEGIFGHRILRGRFENEFLEPEGKKNGPIKKTGNKNPPPPFDIDIVRGSAYGIFSRGFVEYIVNDEKAKALLEWSKKTYSPDEHYWATLHHLYSNPHLRTPGGYPGRPDQKPWLAAYAAWGGRDKCLGMWRHGVCVFGIGDLQYLSNRHELIANKFYMTFQPFALDCMEEYIKFRTRCPAPISDYYKSLPFIRENLPPWYKNN